jgi:hypothetical protein
LEVATENARNRTEAKEVSTQETEPASPAETSDETRTRTKEVTMKTLIAVLVVAFVSYSSAQKTPPALEVHTKALYDSCSVYVRWKATKPSNLPQTAQDATAVGYCKGFFQAFALATGGSVTEPDETGHVQVLKYKESLTLDDFIGAFVDAVGKNPNSLNGDGMDFLLLTIITHHLATFESKPGVYVKKK